MSTATKLDIEKQIAGKELPFYTVGDAIEYGKGMVSVAKEYEQIKHQTQQLNAARVDYSHLEALDLNEMMDSVYSEQDNLLNLKDEDANDTMPQITEDSREVTPGQKPDRYKAIDKELPSDKEKPKSKSKKKERGKAKEKVKGKEKVKNKENIKDKEKAIEKVNEKRTLETKQRDGQNKVKEELEIRKTEKEKRLEKKEKEQKKTLNKSEQTEAEKQLQKGIVKNIRRGILLSSLQQKINNENPEQKEPKKTSPEKAKTTPGKETKQIEARVTDVVYKDSNPRSGGEIRQTREIVSNTKSQNVSTPAKGTSPSSPSNKLNTAKDAARASGMVQSIANITQATARPIVVKHGNNTLMTAKEGNFTYAYINGKKVGAQDASKFFENMNAERGPLKTAQLESMIKLAAYNPGIQAKNMSADLSKTQDAKNIDRSGKNMVQNR